MAEGRDRQQWEIGSTIAAAASQSKLRPKDFNPYRNTKKAMEIGSMAALKPKGIKTRKVKAKPKQANTPSAEPEVNQEEEGQQHGI